MTKLKTYMITHGKARFAKIVGDPVGGYPEGTGPLEWTVDVVLSDEQVAEVLKNGTSPKYIKETKDGEKYVKFTRKAVKADGTPGKPITIIDHAGHPWDNRKIGNGSLLNVSYTLNTIGTGKTARLKPSILELQVWELVKFTPPSRFPTKEGAIVAEEVWVEDGETA